MTTAITIEPESQMNITRYSYALPESYRHMLLIHRIFQCILSVLLLFITTQTIVQAAGNLMVTPTRIVFEQRTRTAQVTLVNQGAETSNFRISFIRQNMTEHGDFVAVAENEAGLYSDTMVRFSPRQVTLPPGQSQVIRLMLRKPRELADGEYRSHMLFQALPRPSSTSVENIAKKASEGITIELIPVVGVSIPVIVRQGDVAAKITLTDAKIVPADKPGSSDKLAVYINREGTSSAYGDFRVTFTPKGEDSTPIVVAQANSIAVYANISKRLFELPLQIPPGFTMKNGNLDIDFLKPGKDPESGLLARTRLAL